MSSNDNREIKTVEQLSQPATQPATAQAEERVNEQPDEQTESRMTELTMIKRSTERSPGKNE